MNRPRIAVVGIACRYPDADSPARLWENVLAGRRAFRRLPQERTRLEDYYSPDPAAPDRFYARKAAVIEGWNFDRVEHRVAGSTYRSTDLAHWLALDTAAAALTDAGFPGGAGLDAANAGAIIGNTLTGEFSRANGMRLRWPYVRRTVGAALRGQGWDDAALGVFLDELERSYKSPFPPIDEDTLAGGLANTIAGRICNHFDFKGGGFTVDGACSSSLLSVATACDALADGRLDVALAGGVDLSIDPFELVGFAKTGALATGEMLVYDRGSNGFWPGEGCGMFVLMRDTDAVRDGRFRHATIAGWGYSSDGRGGITRPEPSGHRLALRRAYASAGFGIDTVAYLEGHGTGTAVGDAAELLAFSEERRAADPDAPPAAISTVKGNIGHTKAAAGAAGLLKAVLAVRHQIIPPATGHRDTHPQLDGERPALRVPATASLWPAGAPVRAGVSSMGFGGINAHVVVEHADGVRRERLGRVTERVVRSRQDAELLLIDADGAADLRAKAARLAALCGRLSFAELGDLAAALHGDLAARPLRAAVVAADPEEAQSRFEKLLALLDSGARSALDQAGGVYLGAGAAGGSGPRIGFLFPGQGAGRRGDGGALRRRFARVDELYTALGLPEDGDQVDTAVAQPRIAASSAAGLRVLADLGIEAVGAVGHSLGELTALHWAGAMDEAALLRIARLRGRVMAESGEPGGSMAGIAAPPEEVAPLLEGLAAVIAGYNGPRQTIVSGPADAVARVAERAAARGLDASRIAVSHAFHSPAFTAAAGRFGRELAAEAFGPPAGAVLSGVTGDELSADADLPALLARQMLEPVRFAEAAGALARRCDLLIEVGPGRILRGLCAAIAPAVPAVSLDADSRSLAGLLHTAAAAYTLGAAVRLAALFEDRFTRPFPLDKEPVFLANPCEAAPEGLFADGATQEADGAGAAPGADGDGSAGIRSGDPAQRENSLELLLRLAAQRAELPLAAVRAESNPLDELHLSSITVGQIVNQASRELGVVVPSAAFSYATSTLGEIAAMLDELAATAGDGADQAPAIAQGAGPWVRAFGVELVPAAVPPAVGRPAPGGGWQVFAPEGHPLAAAAHQALVRAGLGGGVLLCLPRECDEDHVGLMLDAARAALALPDPARFVVVGARRSAAGLAKTLHLEAPRVAVTVVELPLPEGMSAPDAAEAARRIAAEVSGTGGFSEACYDAQGARFVPLLRPLAPLDAHRVERGLEERLGAADVLLVTGGGKGITAECALALGRESGAALALLGRSDPAEDPQLAANLARMAEAGVRYHYVRAEVSNAQEVKAAVEQVRATLGPVTAVLHGAGRNAPRALADLDEAAFRATLAPKIGGLETVLAAVDPASLRLLVSFGSIIGRAGLRGQGDYATANDWLTELTRRVGELHPGCRCLSIEWSVWSGTGMGERLGVLESLTREGIEPIPVEDGVALLKRLIADPDAPVAVVVAGRTGQLPTIAMEQRELPLLRFVERPQVHYPGIELVVDADLSVDTDPYLADHLLDGDLLLPAVLGIEAMAQCATALTGRADPPTLHDAEFLRPIVVPTEGGITIRIAVLADDDGSVRAVVRSSETGFQADHFRATLRYGGPGPEGTVAEPAEPAARSPLRPDQDLYGPVLFQGTRFQRVLGYRRLWSTGCVADIAAGPSGAWFAGYLPADLVAGDPGARDAFMHAIQCCVPDATLLPEGVERLHLADPAGAGAAGGLTLYAVERSREGDSYVYDLDVRDPAGSVVEHWHGLRLRAVRKLDGAGPWIPALLGPYLERRTEEMLGQAMGCVVWPDGGEPAVGVAARRARTAEALGWALGTGAVSYRPDGKPESPAAAVGASHGGRVTFAVSAPHGPGADAAGSAAARVVACDVQDASERCLGEWADLLGAEGDALAHLLAEERGEDYALAATRVWGAVECLRKAGRAQPAGLVAASGPRADGWVLLRSGTARIAGFATTLRGTAHPVVFTMLTQEG